MIEIGSARGAQTQHACLSFDSGNTLSLPLQLQSHLLAETVAVSRHEYTSGKKTKDKKILFINMP